MTSQQLIRSLLVLTGNGRDAIAVIPLTYMPGKMSGVEGWDLGEMAEGGARKGVGGAGG